MFSVFKAFRRRMILLSGTMMLIITSPAFAAEAAFEFQKGDRVLFLGNTMIERAQLYGPLETSLAMSYPELDLTFRNLGWSGDTVWADSRGIFEAPEKGYEKMLAQVKSIDPTVIVLGYGGNEAFSGADRLQAFADRYRKLIADLKQQSKNPRFIFLSPLPHPDFGDAYPDPESYNDQVKLYAAETQKIAQSEEALYIDLIARFSEPAFHQSEPGKYFERSMNLTEVGYLAWADEILHQFGIDNVDLRHGLPDEWSTVHEKVLKKNELYFHHWRPQNITYLLLFRKHEQGNNAVELDELLQLTADTDKQIHQLARQK
ncbi:SGNH/GDSL hydrolase family protein [Polystyrenella longa]|nr:SGNH/GDSL hydrolase family protein [Polystyrenella longa]